MTRSGGCSAPSDIWTPSLEIRAMRGQNGGCRQIKTLQGASALLMDSATTPIPPYAVPRPDVTSATVFRKQRVSVGASTETAVLYSAIVPKDYRVPPLRNMKVLHVSPSFYPS